MDLTSSQDCSMHMLPGDHFFIRSAAETLLRLLRLHLTATIEVAGASTPTAHSSQLLVG
jgi:surfactin synthase thioesterase subunit